MARQRFYCGKILLTSLAGCTAFQQPHGWSSIAAIGHQNENFPHYSPPTTVLRMGPDDNDSSNRNEESPSILDRFVNPVIDDPGLPLSDGLVTQVIAPTLQIAWLSLQHAPQPTWLRPIFDTDLLYSRQGSLVAPALIHGASLASCWIVGALAAKAYERKSISPVKVEGEESDWDYSRVIKAILQGGAFATGLLIFSTQADLFFEYGRWVQLGESEEIDFRLLVALVEMINDIVFEAATITFWRLYLAYQTQRMAKDSR